MTTYHGLQRTKERTGYNTKSSMRFIQNAIERGRTAETLPIRERDYLLNRSSGDDRRAILYNTYCFILGDDNYCITMFPVPEWFGKKTYHDGKRKIKDIRKYIRHYNLFDTEENYYGGECYVV